MSVSETITRYGADLATDAELLAAVFGYDIPSAKVLLGGGTLQDLLKLTLAGPRVSSLAELVRRSTRTAPERLRITSPKAAGDYLEPKAAGLTEEQFGLLALNAKGDLIGEAIIGMGTCTTIAISPREVFRKALALGATSALVWHNHPSGDPSPSKEDQALTKRLRASGEGIGVPLADHIIVGDGRSYSFRGAEGWDHGN